MKKCLFALVLIGICQSFAIAELLEVGLTFNGRADTLKDEAVGLVYDVNTDGFISSGDVMQGVIRLDEVTRDGTSAIPYTSVYAVYSFNVDAVSGRNVDLKPATGTYSIANILSAIGLGTGGLTNYSGTLANASMAFFEKPSYVPLANVDANLASPSNKLINIDNIGGVISAANGWSVNLVAGMVGDDFYRIFLSDALYSDLSILGLQDPDTVFAQYRMAASVLYHSFNANSAFLPLVSDRDFTAGIDNRVGDITTAGNNLFAKPSSIATAGGWDVSMDGNFRINAIPEPNSMLLLSCVAGMGLLRSRRRQL